MKIILLMLILSLSACSRNIDMEKDRIEVEEPRKTEAKGEEPLEIIEKDEIEGLIQGMSLEEKIGQLFIFGLNGDKIDQNAIDLIEKHHIGGFVFFRENIKNPEQTVEFLNKLKEINKNKPIPLFLSIDEEGGRVSRLPSEFPKMPGAKVLGDINNQDLSFQYGKILAMRIKSLGFNMDFAPVMDINSNPENPVIGDRAFGNTIDIVVNNSLETMKGINSENIISVIKHFPGHGDTNMDSHIDIPIIDKDLKEINDLELIPFKEAIENGVDSIMIGHILFPALDNKPATLSTKIINDLLRKELDFNGVVISDDLNMGAIVRNYTMEEAVIEFLNAGGDIALICHGGEEEYKIFDIIKREVENENISEEEIDQKVYRIIELKKKYNIEDNIIENLNLEIINQETKIFLDKIKEF
ncbi:MAG: beta-N-acetylhexosaminidase [Tissierellia bacterium]|nr:beta-N-acetylhexosaminidase [Tissierellia bacterium]